jgi:lipopolysaccharide heptosyltransferase III
MNFSKVKRVLIYRLGSLGDTVVALPALHLIERSFPGARRVLLTNVRVHLKAPSAFSVLTGSGLVHDFIDYPSQTRSIRALASVWWKLVRFRPEVVIYLMRKRGSRSLERDAWFFRVCGARRVMGLPLGDLQEPRYDPETQTWEHEGARLARCLRALGEAAVGDPASWDLRLTPAEEQRAREVLAPLAGLPLVACGPGTKMQSKDWGQENWRELLTRLGAEMPRHGLVLVGADEDAVVSEFASAGWRAPVVNLCGQLTPRETAAVLKRTELFLGPDSGPMHLAAAYGVPCAIVYASRTLRGHWFPIGEGHQVVYHTVDCSLCLLEVCIENRKKCITSVSVGEMIEAARKAWLYGQSRLVHHQ